MRESVRLSRFLVASLLGLGGSVGSGFSLSLDDVVIDSFEVQGVCTPIEGEHPVSIQPAVQYKLAGNDEAAIIYGKPKERRFQSFECGKTKATIYYYEYETREELASRLSGLKEVLWGEAGPTRLHPELVLDMDNILAVVSSREPAFFARLLSHRETFPELTDAVVDDRIKRLRCGAPKEDADELCSALRDFRRGTYPPSASGEVVLVGRSWDVSEKSDPDQNEIYEALYIDRIPGAGTVASFGGVEPENEEERRQILSQMAAQKEGSIAASAEALISYLRDSYGKTTARARNLGGRSLAFIGMGNRVYLRAADHRLVLVTDLMHEEKKAPYVVAVFEGRATGK